MHLRRPSAAASKRQRGQASKPMLFALLLALAAGCAPSGSPPGPSASGASVSAKLTACGTASTAAGVKVHVEIAKGSVPCGTALTIVQDYAKAIQSGRAPGNGGGGPVKISGWTCRGFTTPVVDQTGDTSKCVRDGDEILEILLPQ